MQYTIRGIPKALDAALRRRAKDEGKSLNAVALLEVRIALDTNLWIAALVQQHSLVLCARDRHFDRLPQLARL